MPIEQVNADYPIGLEDEILEEDDPFHIYLGNRNQLFFDIAIRNLYCCPRNLDVNDKSFSINGCKASICIQKIGNEKATHIENFTGKIGTPYKDSYYSRKFRVTGDFDRVIITLQPLEEENGLDYVRDIEIQNIQIS